MKNYLIKNKRFYCGGKNKEGKQLPIIDELLITKSNKIFSDAKHREDLLTFWKKTQKNKAQSIIPQHPIILEQERIIEQEEQVQEQKQLPKILQQIITKTIDNSVNAANTNDNKVKENFEKQQMHSQALQQAGIEFITSIYNSQGWAPIIGGCLHLWWRSPVLQEYMSIPRGLGALKYTVIKVQNFIVKLFKGSNKWKWGAGGIGGSLGTDLVNRLNQKGLDIVPLFEGKKHYAVNLNVKEHIDNQVNILYQNGQEVTDIIVENMLIQGKAILLTKHSLEPLIRDLPLDLKQEYYTLDIFSNDVATQYYNFENIPSILANPIDAIKNITNYTDTIITASQINDAGSLGGGYSIFNLIVGIVVVVGFIYFGGKFIKNNINNNNNIDIIAIQPQNSGGILDIINTYKNNIFYIGTSIIGLSGILGLKWKSTNSIIKEKEEKIDDDSDLC